MPHTDTGKNIAADALAAAATHIGLFSKGPSIAITATAVDDKVLATGHGLNDGDLIIFDTLVGGTGIIAGQTYRVRDAGANDFKITGKVGVAAKDISVDYSSGNVRKLTEISGGTPAYTRMPVAYAAAAEGVADDTNNGTDFNIPAGGSVDYAGYFSALSGGNLLSVAVAPHEDFVGQGIYRLNDSKLQFNSFV